MKTKTFVFQCLLLFSFTVFSQKNNTQLEALLASGDSLSLGRQNKAALDQYLETEKLALQTFDSLSLCYIYYKVGMQHLKLGQFDDAITYYNKSEELSQILKNDSIRSMSLHGLGLAHSQTMKFDVAINYYEKSLKIQQEKVKNARIEAVILNGLAGVYIASNDIGSTIKFSEKALIKAEESKDFDLYSNILNTISICHEKNDDYKEALRYKKRALEICKKHNIVIPTVLIANIGSNFHLLKRIDSALYYYKLAREKAIVTKHDYGLARINYSMGKVFMDIHQPKKSLVYILQSHEFFKDTQNEQMLKQSNMALSNIYTQLKKPSKALAFLKEHVRLNDSLQKRSIEKKLEEFQVKYDAIEKEKHIANLSQENIIKANTITFEQKQKRIQTIIFITSIFLIIFVVIIWHRINKERIVEKETKLRYKSVIQAEQKERKRIAQDLHDSVGQSISLIKMQVAGLQMTSTIEKKKQDKLIEQVDHAYNELHNISHNILPNTLIILGLVPAVKELIEEMNNNGSFQILLDEDGGFKDLNEEQTINLYRIIQESLVNILKYAKASVVRINMYKKNGVQTLFISDDGIGMDTSNLDSFHGMGWKNIFARVALLPGKINVHSEFNKGTSLTVQITPNFD